MIDKHPYVVGIVTKVGRLGVTLRDEFGETHYAGKRQVIPERRVVAAAEWIP